MAAYILRRILLMIPTLFGIMLLSFVIIQFAPGGPVEQAIARMSGEGGSVMATVTGGQGDLVSPGGGAQNSAAKSQGGNNSLYRGSRGLNPKVVAAIEKRFGFDKPPVERFLSMLWSYIRFDFGDSFFRDISVIDLIKEKLPVSITLGVWMTVLSYGISIPLGIRKAVKDGSRFDVWTSGVIVLGYAVPGFLIAIMLIVLFAGGSFWSIFPLKGIVSSTWASLPWWQQILSGDYCLDRQGRAESAPAK